jgi:catechol 2,3-dioxygenase-like lactoylglutathione lyase family enzyme
MDPDTPTLGLVILAVADLSRAVRFYRAAFAWPLREETPVYAEFALPAGQRLGLYERAAFARLIGRAPAEAPASGVTGTELYFYPDDVDAAADRLVTAGARRLSGLARRDWGDEAAYFADPDGNVLVVARVAFEGSAAVTDAG